MKKKVTAKACQGSFLSWATPQKGICRANPATTTACQCRPPRMPWNRSAQTSSWNRECTRNHQLLLDQQHESSRSLDVVFYGDSIIQHFHAEGHKQSEVHNVYETWFRQPTSPLHGLALGVRGDRCTNLLYRLQSGGELPAFLQPRLVWILIGTNDMGADGCSAETVTACIIHLIQWIQQVKPNAVVVLNSILPRGDHPWATSDSVLAEIAQTNAHLACWAHQTHGVEWFDATHLFMSNNDRVNASLFVDGLHPNGLGMQVWTSAMVDFAQQLLKQPGR